MLMGHGNYQYMLENVGRLDLKLEASTENSAQ